MKNFFFQLSNKKSQQIRLWDPLLRVLHWVFAWVYVSNYFLNEAGEDWHEYLGYLAMTAVVIRFGWAFTGPESARWRHFFPSFAQLREHFQALKDGEPYSRLGHTPIGALVMLFMLLLLAALGVTGFMMEEIDYFWGEEWLQELHHTLANMVTGLVVLHLVAAIYQSKKTKENYFLSMITGKRRSK